jgi:hypothetical protein
MAAPETTALNNKGFENKDKTRTGNAGPRDPLLSYVFTLYKKSGRNKYFF